MFDKFSMATASWWSRHGKRRVRTQGGYWAALLCVVIGSLALTVRAANFDLGGLGLLGEGETEGAIDDFLGLTAQPDFTGLRHSVFIAFDSWTNVKPRRVKKGEPTAEYTWALAGEFVAPLGERPITALITVPEAGVYRLFVRHVMGVRQPHPFRVGLTQQQERNDGTTTRYTPRDETRTLLFGNQALLPGQRGQQLEKTMAVRMERATDLIGVPTANLCLWEYRDIELNKAVYELSLQSDDMQVRVHSLLLTQAKDFRPSLATFLEDRTLGRLYMRARITKSGVEGKLHGFAAGLGYHWRGRSAPGSTEPSWYWNIGSVANVAAGDWSPFIEATDAVLPAPGPWSTCTIRFAGVANGMAEVQFAWYPHEAAVMHTIETGVGAGSGMFRMPSGNGAMVATHGRPVWGMWRETHLDRIETQERILDRYFSWAAAAAEKMNISPDHPRLKRLRVFTGCGVNPVHQTRTVEMLAKLGINWIPGAPESVVRRFDLIDEKASYNSWDVEGISQRMTEAQRRKHTLHKAGDEISTLGSPANVDGNPEATQRFQAYLREQAQRSDMTIPDFLGVQDLAELQCLGALPANAGRYERRLMYHSHRFLHLDVAHAYRGLIERAAIALPYTHVYCNYSPHPLFLTGTTMNHSDWFVLCRNRAQTLGWAEDWATGGSWGLGTAQQCVTYYAALVACAVRTYDYPAGFYVGVNCGGAARKMFSCVGQGLTWLHLYDWGPIDRWAEGSNAWSEHEHEYYSVMCATHALAPADEILAEGKREPRRTAVLYNRSHEIWQGGTGRLNHDWMWTFLGLMSDQIPVDVIIEEDLTPETLAPYTVLFLGGFNLDRIHLGAVRDWVEQGNLVIGAGGSLQFDIYNEPLVEANELFGATQRLASDKETEALGKAQFTTSDLYPEMEIEPHGMKYLLQPTTAEVIARYESGQPAATVRRVGKGRALLIGFHPGFTFQQNGRHTGIGRTWLNAPVLRTLGRQRLEFDHPASEVILFEHASGLAVTLSDIGRSSPVEGHLLSVQPNREIREVVSGLHGPLEWTKKGDRIEVRTRQLNQVDVIILR